MNVIILEGRVGATIKVNRYMNDNGEEYMYGIFSMAINKYHGQKEKVLWIKCVLSDRFKGIFDRITQGRLVSVRGELNIEIVKKRIEDREVNFEYCEVQVKEFNFLDKANINK